ncbi:MAG: serine/threonine protein kinase [Planctomycetes bacterium]|nr:serine/threonine protein kinase [Planctomycetota bacterium]
MSGNGGHRAADSAPIEEITDDELRGLDAYRDALAAGQRISPEDWIRNHPQSESAIGALRALAALHDPEQTQPEHARAKTPASALEQANPATSISFSPQPPEIPGYEFLGLCGRGGRGVVWKARRIALGRVAAVKMILAGQFADVADVERFLREVKLAAGLSHPNIVKVHDAGIVAGQPYLTMEYIDGKTLAQLAQGPDALPVRKAAEFVRTVALAVQYLHEHNILHRDLKPANVLLERAESEGQRVESGGQRAESESGDGGSRSALSPPLSALRPKITDFGLAKQIEGGTALTASGDVIGSPSYMPPEQAAGEQARLGPWTDVYGLGAILYELLAGRPPFRAETRAATLNQVLDPELDPLAPLRLNPQVDPDLDTICMKALAKDPSRRYPTASALADDIGHWLAGEPILARAASRLERLWRWCRRRPAVAGLLAMLILAFATGFSGVTWQWLRAEGHRRQAEDNLKEVEKQRARAEENFRQAREAVEQVDNLAGQAADREWFSVPGSQKIRKRLLETARSYYVRFVEQHRDDPSLRKQLALTAARVARITDEIGTKPEALAAYEQALDLFEKLSEEHPGNVEYQRDLAKTYGNLAVLHDSMQKIPDSLRYYEQARTILEKLLAAPSGDVEMRRDLAAIDNNVAVLQHGLGNLKEAIRLHLETLKLREQLAREDPDNSMYQDDLAGTYNNLATVQRENGQIADAVTSHHRAIEIREKLANTNPVVTDYWHELAWSHNNLGNLQLQNGAPNDALASYERAHAIWERLAKENPAVSAFQSALAMSTINVARVQFGTGKTAEAIRRAEAAVEVFEQLVQKNPKAVEYRWRLAQAHHDLGAFRLNAHVYDGVIDGLDRAREIVTDLVESNPENAEQHAELAVILNDLGLALVALNRTDDAVLRYREAIDHQRQALERAPRSDQFRQYLNGHYSNLAEAQRALGRLADAAATALERKALWPDDRVVLYDTACELALCAAAVARDKAELTPEEQAERKKYADQAVGLLWQAVRAGFDQFDHMRTDPDLEAIRSHPRFKELTTRRAD